MFPEVFRAIRALRPKAILLENVRGLVREAFRPYFNYILAQLALPYIEQHADETWYEHAARLEQLRRSATVRHDERYDVAWELVNVADYGVPQERHRVFVVAYRHDLNISWSFPAPTHARDALLYAQYVDGSYWQEHGLPTRTPPVALTKQIDRLRRQPKRDLLRWRTVRDALRDLPEPTDRIPHPQYFNHVGIPDARIYPGHTGSPWDWPSKAIKAGDHGNPGGENMLRRDDGTVRYFTVRELARLQSFPDDWQFANSWTESRRQLGNAVPVRLATHIAESIRDALTMPVQSRPPACRVEQLVADLA
jgi:DNA (cytosine-5)-methyltransferase 1